MKADVSFEPTETGFRYTLSIPLAAHPEPDNGMSRIVADPTD
jgi:hypothetical protein